MTSPVEERNPPGLTVTVPPIAPCVNAPKVSCCAVTVTIIGRGGGSWATNNDEIIER